jgi:hypothetical protein
MDKAAVGISVVGSNHKAVVGISVVGTNRKTGGRHLVMAIVNQGIPLVVDGNRKQGGTARWGAKGKITVMGIT